MNAGTTLDEWATNMPKVSLGATPDHFLHAVTPTLSLPSCTFTLMFYEIRAEISKINLHCAEKNVTKRSLCGNVCYAVSGLHRSITLEINFIDYKYISVLK